MQRLDGSTTLHDGTRLRVRMPHRSDRELLHALFARLGLQVDELALSRALRFDPREHLALVATRWAGHNEEVVGFAAMGRRAAGPELVIADDAGAAGTGAVLEAALRAHSARGHRTG